MLRVAFWSAEALDKKFAEALLRACHVVTGVERAEDVVGRHLSIERGDKTLEAVFADHCINLSVEEVGHRERQGDSRSRFQEPSGWRV